MQSPSTTTMLVLVILVGAAFTASGSSHLVGEGAIEHCGHSDGLSISCRDDEGIQLRFDSASVQSALTIDFVMRGMPLSHAERVVEIFFTSRRPSGRAPLAVTFQIDHHSYPLATNVESSGVVKSVMSLESFVNLAMTSPIQGMAFGDRFAATDRQMLTLRLAVGRWATYPPS